MKELELKNLKIGDLVVIGGPKHTDYGRVCEVIEINNKGFNSSLSYISIKPIDGKPFANGKAIEKRGFSNNLHMMT